jgi:S-adenosylmethionine:tRNA ribosyltransferase-isomerase
MDCRVKPDNDSLAMRTDLFDFELPASCIALRPATPRDSARMLVVQPDEVLRDRVVADLPQWLEPGDQLVVNDTKVISAQGAPHRPRHRTEDRGDADQAARRFALAGAGQAVKKALRGRRGSVRQ